MRLAGAFASDTAAAQLASLSSTPALLERASSLRDVSGGQGAPVRAVFSPVTPLGVIPLDTTITVLRESETGAELAVVSSRGTQQVEVALTIELEPTAAGTDVRWTAEMKVRGTMASVGQRVAGDLATREIGRVLAEAAAAAGAGELLSAAP